MLRTHIAIAASTVAAAFVLMASSAAAQTKFAVVDVQRAVMETEDGLRAHATLKKLFDRRQNELDTRQNELKRAKDDIDKQSKALSKEAQQRRIAEWQQNVAELQNVFVEFNNELQKEQTKITQPILERVLSVVRQVAAQDGYDAILDKNAVPYARSDMDLTDRVIQQYNAGTSGQSSTAPGKAGSKPASKPAPAKKPATR